MHAPRTLGCRRKPPLFTAPPPDTEKITEATTVESIEESAHETEETEKSVEKPTADSVEKPVHVPKARNMRKKRNQEDTHALLYAAWEECIAATSASPEAERLQMAENARGRIKAGRTPPFSLADSIPAPEV